MITFIADFLGWHKHAVIAVAAFSLVVGLAGSVWIAIEVVQGWERDRIEAAANEARIEHMEGARDVEREIEGLGRDGFNDAIDGLPRREPNPTTVQ